MALFVLARAVSLHADAELVARSGAQTTPSTLNEANALLVLGQSQEKSGDTDQALATYARVIDLSPSPTYPARIAMLSIAGIHAVRGNQEMAYSWLNKLADSHPAPTFLTIIGGAKEFESLRSQPRFKQVLERITPCNSAEYHEFDFWVGSWEVQNPQGQVVGHNDITRLVGGCILQETWASSRASQTGTSFNFYDSRDKKWHQDYYDNSGNMGNYPPLTGEFRDGKMVLLSAPDVRPLSRWTWYEMAPGSVRQMAEQSADGGKTWTITWDSVYVKK